MLDLFVGCRQSLFKFDIFFDLLPVFRQVNYRVHRSTNDNANWLFRYQLGNADIGAANGLEFFNLYQLWVKIFNKQLNRFFKHRQLANLFCSNVGWYMANPKARQGHLAGNVH